ncbi:MAG: sugar ABC transporter permease [bacterium]|nr:sugar ABC transporter permease [Candidatus Sumerlaeota bacterium]
MFSRKTKEALCGYLFIMPNLAGFLAFTLLPVAASLLLSFTNWDIFNSQNSEFIGLRNFTSIIGLKLRTDNMTGLTDWLCFWNHLHANDPRFWQYLWNTFFFMIGIPLSMFGSLALALVMNTKLRGINFFRALYFIPTIAAGVAMYQLWRWLLNPDFGLLNQLLSVVGINGPNWLGSPLWVKPALIFMGFWTSIGGYNMLLYLAGLQGIPPHLYEAADIDGASNWQKFRNITWPMLSSTTFFIVTMSLIGAFQGGFDSLYVLTRGGPAGSSTTIAYYIYQKAFEQYYMGYASALAWILFIFVFAATLLNWKFGGRRVHYY